MNYKIVGLPVEVSCFLIKSKFETGIPGVLP